VDVDLHTLRRVGSTEVVDSTAAVVGSTAVVVGSTAVEVDMVAVGTGDRRLIRTY
jgi:hypothetical protein